MKTLKLKKNHMTMLISDKVAFKTKHITGDSEGHLKMIKGSIHQEDKTKTNIYMHLTTEF